MRDEDEPVNPNKTTTDESLLLLGGWFLLALGLFALLFGAIIFLSPHKDSRATQAHFLAAYAQARILRESLEDPALRLTPASRRKIDGLLSGIQKDIVAAEPDSDIMASRVMAGFAFLAFGIIAAQVGWERTAPDRKGVRFSLKRKKQP